VCLFVNASPALMAEAAAVIPHALFQFHGDETPQQCEAAGRPYLRAARMVPGVDLLDFARRYGTASGLLLDAHVEGYGGGGKVFDWSLIPSSVPVPVVLSGGLSPANVIDGVLRVRPWAVDVSSGVESAKGVKDAALIHRFCDAVRDADSRIADAIN
jgi:phosphoribosylanthranilate isomerase